MVGNWDQFNRRYHTGWLLLWDAFKIVWDFFSRKHGRSGGGFEEKRRRKKGWGYY